ncbi:MAG: ABC transporter ATP-binding protein/permease [gamma proteobacterium symbiont of Bathyaustriella thionipta]|nr:ABC transporter ATP-binding protein/permease [gamma proteobacterium symbiont of Bathyaustriella thionipta]
MKPAATKHQRLRFSTLIGFVTPYRWLLLLSLGLMLLESGVTLLTPWLAGQFTQGLLQADSAYGGSLNRLLALWLLVLLLKAVLHFASRTLVVQTGEQMLANLRCRLYDHLQALPLSYYQHNKRGETLALLTNDAALIGRFVTVTLLRLLPHFLTLAGALLLVFLLNPIMALLAVLLLPLLFLIMKLLGRRIRPASRAMVDEYAATFSIVEENLNLLPVIKSFACETRESQRFQQGNQRLYQLTRRYLLFQSALSPLIHLLTGSSILLLLWLGVEQVQAGQLTPAELVSLLLYGFLMSAPMGALADLYGQIQTSRGAAERLQAVFALAPEPQQQGAARLASAKGDIEFRGVHFQYAGRDELLSGLDLTIRAGETIAITGNNGSGKSTLAHLLMRFVDPQKGRILIDGVDIQQVSLSSLRRQMGLVQQHVLLLNGSVRDNIAFAHPQVSEEELRAAAEAARALEFIENLPQGFATLIGDQGVRLSGGQKQRLALARALLKDPPILLLDEATAMFDPQAEQSFIRQCHEHLRARTVILITHRPASLALADRILELRDGRLFEQEKK